MRSLPKLLTAVLFGSALLLAGCDSTGVNDEEDDDEPTDLIRVDNLPADPDTTTGGGRPQGYNQHTFFSLRDSSIVLRYDNENRADSASTEWDLAFQSVNILVNGGTSGPGEAAAYVTEEPFQDVTEVDTERLETDNADAGEFAIPQGSGNGWYSYNANGNNIVRPTAGRTIVVRTADGEAYAKIRMLSYYEGAPDDPAESDAESRYYTFEYVLQDDGTSFE